MDFFEKFDSASYFSGDFSQILKSVYAGKNVVVHGLSTIYKALLAGAVKSDVLLLCSDIVNARELQKVMEELSVPCALLEERYDVLTYKQQTIGSQMRTRLKSLDDIMQGKAKVIITTATAMMQYYPKKELYRKHRFTLESGKEYPFKRIAENLVGLGYVRVEKVELRGEFSIKGDIVEIFASTQDNPVRVCFFDELIENVNLYNLENMSNIEDLTFIDILPTTDLLAPIDEVKTAIVALSRQVKKYSDNERLMEILVDIETVDSHYCSSPALLYLVPFLKDSLATLEEILSPDTLIWIDEARVFHDKARLIYSEHKARVKNLSESGEILFEHIECLRSPENSEKMFSRRRLIATMPPSSLNPYFAEYVMHSYRSTQIPLYYLDRLALLADMKNYSYTGYTVLICCKDTSRAKVFKDSLEKDDIYSTVLSAEFFEGDITSLSGLYVTDLKLEKGFVLHSRKLVIVGASEIARQITRDDGKKSKRTIFTVPEKDEYVVHEVHGIGLCGGVERIKVGGAYRDYVVVQYKGGDKLFVPIENMDSLSKYSGKDGNPAVSKMGGKDFEKVKEKVKNSVKELAFSLLELYAKRSKMKGIAYPPDSEWQQEFEDMFPYEPTEDQAKAVDEIKNDLESGKLMDRLLCGDVGYGKTEVALRIAFKVAIEGKQVAFLAPTTILTMQHYNTMKDRFEHFGLNVDLLCRFKSKDEIAKSIEDIKSGKTNIVVGTHRLLSKDVIYKDLGLLVLDEEQRFGVQHKEQIQNLKNTVAVLAMSATPIPRTLNMALTGVRDISVLETPPLSRLPIQTFVTEYRESLVADSVIREISRGGQVFILFNRVETIIPFANKIANISPEIKIRIAHGQMDSLELEKNIADFYNREANVLVCTTIIQNGIDLPDANTLIVVDADKLGLSELYQLRGRVGRSDKLAYAYFTVKADKVITEDAMKRLTALMDYTDFGSGFKIAMRDLEIRGAGNILGREQHGHVIKVGYEMYCQLLDDAIKELSGVEQITKVNTEMNVDIDAFATDELAESLGGKMKLYKKIADIQTENDRFNLFTTIKKQTRFVPESLTNLIDIAYIKALCNDVDVNKVILTQKLFRLYFASAKCLENSQLMAKISDRKECRLSVSADIILDFNFTGLTVRDKMNYLMSFLKQR